MGEVPEWYAVLRAAKYIGCPPWELAAQPEIWRQWALAAEGIEAAAQAERRKK
jgi:hypothetical protein